MTAISFSCETKKQALILHECNQTIRPKGKREIKVGDKLTLYWHQRYKEKCDEDVCLNYICDMFGDCGHGSCNPYNQYRQFNNILGYGEVIDVQYISLGIDLENCRIDLMDTARLNYGNFNDLENLAKADGFETVWDFIKWFDTHYDLSTPKEFTVIHWRWIEK